MDDKVFLDALHRPDVELRNPFGDGIDVYFVGESMFALWYSDKRPRRVSLRCDSLLSKDLRERYESVMPGENLDPKRWNTLVITEQLGEQFVLDMINHAHQLAYDENASS